MYKTPIAAWLGVLIALLIYLVAHGISQMSGQENVSKTVLAMEFAAVAILFTTYIIGEIRQLSQIGQSSSTKKDGLQDILPWKNIKKVFLVLMVSLALWNIAVWFHYKWVQPLISAQIQ